MVDRPPMLDDVEREILYHLQTDARNMTNAELSEVVGVSATTVGQRICDLEDRGIIETYETRVNYQRAGFPHRILLLCSIDLTAGDDVADDLVDRHGVVSVRELISGDRNLHVEIVAHDRDEVVDTIESIEDDGIDVQEAELINDEVRQPFDQFYPQRGA